MTEAEQKLRKELENRIQFETLISDISALFVCVSSDQVDQQIEQALTRIRVFFGVDRCGLLKVQTGPPIAFVTHASYGEGIEQVSKDINVAELFPWTYEQAIVKGLPVAYTQMDELPAEAWRDCESWRSLGVKSRLAIPLFCDQGVRYLLTIQSVFQERQWPGEFVPRLRLLGEIFVNALERKSRDQMLRAFTNKLLTAQEEERRCLARELHDDFTQRLAVLAMDMASLEPAAKAAGKKAESKFKNIQQQLIKLSTDIHDISRQLHPSVIDDLGLRRAIQLECVNFARRTGISVACQLTEFPAGLDRQSAVVLFRVMQESLRNILKHAQVKQAEVIFACAPEGMILTIRDHGIGFDPVHIRNHHGLGLFSMQERVQLVGGRLLIDSAPGRGTSIQITVPVSRGSSNE